MGCHHTLSRKLRETLPQRRERLVLQIKGHICDCMFSGVPLRILYVLSTSYLKIDTIDAMTWMLPRSSAEVSERAAEKPSDMAAAAPSISMPSLQCDSGSVAQSASAINAIDTATKSEEVTNLKQEVAVLDQALIRSRQVNADCVANMLSKDMQIGRLQHDCDRLREQLGKASKSKTGTRSQLLV